MTCKRCGGLMQQDTDSEGLLWWYCADIECNPKCLLERPA